MRELIGASRTGQGRGLGHGSDKDSDGTNDLHRSIPAGGGGEREGDKSV